MGWTIWAFIEITKNQIKWTTPMYKASIYRVYTHECLNGKMFNLISHWSHNIIYLHPFKSIHWLLSDPQINVFARTSELLCHLCNCTKQQKIQFFYFIAHIYRLFYMRHFIIVYYCRCAYNNIIQKVVIVNNIQKSNFPSCLIRNVVFGF